MATIILYTTDSTYIDKTIDEVVDKTDSQLLEEFIVCDDNNCGIEDDRVTVLKTSNVGPAVAFDAAIKNAKSDDIVLLRGAVKVKDGWLEPLVGVPEKHLISPITHVLETSHWSTQDRCMRRYGYRWDMSLYDRPDPDHPVSPSASPVCVGFHRGCYEWLGGFDQGMRPDEPGEILELSIRTWMCGGSVLIAETSHIASPEMPIPAKFNNSARIVERWFDTFSSCFYERKNKNPDEFNIGKLGTLAKRVVSAEDYLAKMMPEMLGVYKLRNAAVGKTIAIVGTGPSIDKVNPAEIYRHDVIIGVDYMGLVFDCDYMATFDAQVVVALRERYVDPKFILPLVLHNRTTSTMVSATEVADGPIVCELARENDSVASLHPPFINFDNVALFAAHIALFLGAKSVTLFGVDNKIIGGKSHSSKIDYYDDGEVWADSETVRREFAKYEFGLDMLGKLANSVNVPLLRVNHA